MHTYIGINLYKLMVYLCIYLHAYAGFCVVQEQSVAVLITLK